MADFGDIGNNITLSGGESVRRNAGNTDFEAFETPILNGKAEQYYGGDGAFHDIPTVVSAFLDDTASDITGYKTLKTTLPAGSIANVATSITGAATVVKAFALAAGVFDFISGQVLHLHIHAAKTAGTKTADLYVKIYHRTSGGVETLIGTSDATASLPGSNTEFDLSVAVPDTAFSATDRFVAKYLSDPSGSGTDPIVTIYYQGNTNSRVEIGTSLTTSGATDANAVHVNVAGEIAAITAKASPVSGDYLLIEDSADANNKKSITIGTLPTGTIGGSSGSTDNAAIRADGTGGATIQSSLVTIDDTGTIKPVALDVTSGPIQFESTINPGLLSGDQNNYNPTGLSTAVKILITSSVDIVISGLVGGAEGRLLTVMNNNAAGGKLVTLTIEDTNSTAGNRFAGNDKADIKPQQSMLLCYIGSPVDRWCIIGVVVGGSGTIGGATGSTDNAVLRADGTGGATVQSSAATIDDSGTVNIPTGQTYNINSAPHTHAYTERSGATTDGHLAVWNGSSADSIKDGGVVPSVGAPTTTPYVTTASDAGLSAEVVIPGLASSADILGAAGAGTSEEYDTATTGLTWNNTPTTVNSNTTIKSHLYILDQADTTERLGTKAWSPAGALDARAKINGALNYSTGAAVAIGLHIGNSDNSSRVLVQIRCGTSPDANAWTYAGSYTQRGTNFALGRSLIYARITRDGSNNWTFYISNDGLLWQLVATQALTFTVANIGFRLAGNATNTTEASVDWLRTDV